MLNAIQEGAYIFNKTNAEYIYIYIYMLQLFCIIR